MTLDNPRNGNNYLPNFQVSALPYVTASTCVTGSATEVDFPFVTSFVTVRVTGSNVRVGFTANGVLGSNYATATSTVPVDMRVRDKSIFIAAAAGAGNQSFEVIAGMTGIPTSSFAILTGSAGITPVSFSFGYGGLG